MARLCSASPPFNYHAIAFYAILNLQAHVALKERAIFKAYVSAEDPLAELLQLAAQARMQNWHSNYHNAIGILIRCSKELNH